MSAWRGTVKAGDGTALGYLVTGTGPPLVLVHGGGTDHRCFDPLLPVFTERFTVIAYDRRGRGLSGDQPGVYSLAREATDLIELIEALSLDVPVRVLAYSYGGLVTLEALVRAPRHFEAVVLYEMPIGVPGMFPPGLVEDVRAQAAAGDRNGAARRFVRDTFCLSDRTVDRFEQGPLWPTLLACIDETVRELDAIVATPFVAERYQACTMPVRYLVDRDAGNRAFRVIAELVCTSLPTADVAHVRGIPHFAIPSDTERFLDVTLDFLG